MFYIRGGGVRSSTVWFLRYGNNSKKYLGFGSIRSPCQIVGQPLTPIPGTSLLLDQIHEKCAFSIPSPKTWTWKVRLLRSILVPKVDGSWIHVPIEKHNPPQQILHVSSISSLRTPKPQSVSPWCAQPWDPQNHAVAAKKAFDLSQWQRGVWKVEKSQLLHQGSHVLVYDGYMWCLCYKPLIYVFGGCHVLWPQGTRAWYNSWRWR